MLWSGTYSPRRPPFYKFGLRSPLICPNGCVIRNRNRSQNNVGSWIVGDSREGGRRCTPRPPYRVSYTLLDYDEFISTCQAEEGWTIDNIGPSSDPTKDMFGMLLGDPETQPVIYVVSSIHGNEWQAAYISQAFRRLLVSPPPGHKETFEMLRNTFAWYFVPVGNPYGIQLRKDLPEGDSFTGRYNANGVDLNRNFTTQSQPETQAIVSKFNDLKPSYRRAWNRLHPVFRHRPERSRLSCTRTAYQRGYSRLYWWEGYSMVRSRNTRVNNGMGPKTG